MTKIPPSHLLANRAVLAVSTVLGEAGALCEAIRNDYGEDLLVQTQLDNVADPFRIIIQVKAASITKKRRANRSIRVDISHLQRWASHIEPLLLCVFDDRSKNIYAVLPRERFSLWELSTTKRKSISLELPEASIFDKTTAQRLIWATRIDHYS
jgi:hypothetical protein